MSCSWCGSSDKESSRSDPIVAEAFALLASATRGEAPRRVENDLEAWCSTPIVARGRHGETSGPEAPGALTEGSKVWGPDPAGPSPAAHVPRGSEARGSCGVTREPGRARRPQFPPSLRSQRLHDMDEGHPAPRDSAAARTPGECHSCKALKPAAAEALDAFPLVPSARATQSVREPEQSQVVVLCFCLGPRLSADLLVSDT